MKITEQELRDRLPKLVRHERKIMALVLEHIAEVDRLRLYLKWNHRSLFAYLVQELGYCESSAYARQSAARALHVAPEIKVDLEEGKLHLTQIAMAQSSIRQEEKATGQKVKIEDKKVLFAALKEKTKI
jgi:hypothetical protein